MSIVTNYFIFSIDCSRERKNTFYSSHLHHTTLELNMQKDRPSSLWLAIACKQFFVVDNFNATRCIPIMFPMRRYSSTIIHLLPRQHIKMLFNMQSPTSRCLVLFVMEDIVEVYSEHCAKFS